MTTSQDLTSLTVAELGDRMRTKQVSPVEVAEAFIARADAHMYQAKHDGRNRVSAGAHMPEIRKTS